jgi:hypothetical protein
MLKDGKLQILNIVLVLHKYKIIFICIYSTDEISEDVMRIWRKKLNKQ